MTALPTRARLGVPTRRPDPLARLRALLRAQLGGTPSGGRP